MPATRHQRPQVARKWKRGPAVFASASTVGPSRAPNGVTPGAGPAIKTSPPPEARKMLLDRARNAGHYRIRRGRAGNKEGARVTV